MSDPARPLDYQPDIGSRVTVHIVRGEGESHEHVLVNECDIDKYLADGWTREHGDLSPLCQERGKITRP